NSSGRRLRGFFVVAEMTLALILLVAGGLMVTGFRRMLKSFRGADPETILALHTSLPEAKYKDPEKISSFYRDVLERMQALPSVEAVSAASNTPLNNRPNPNVEFTIEGRPPLQPGERQTGNLLVVSPGYFKTLGLSLRA